MKLSDSRSFRRTLAGTGMILAPALLVLTEIVHPEPKSDAAEHFSVVVANAQRWYLAHALALLSLAVAVPAVLGLMHLLRPVRPAWGHAGATLAFLGLVPLAALIGIEFLVWQMTAIDSPAMVELIDTANGSAGIVLLFVFAQLFPIAWFVFGLGLYLGRVVPTWQAALIALSVPVVFVGDIAYVKFVTIIGAVAFLVGLAPLGWRLLTQTDDEWESARLEGEARPAPAL